METVQCYCSQCKTEDTRQEMGDTNYGKFVSLFEMWERLNWLYEGSSLGCGVKYVYSNDNGNLWSLVKADAKSKLEAKIHATRNFLPTSEFWSTVQDNTKATMSILNDFRKEYLELQTLFNSAKYYKTSYDTSSVVNDAGDSQLVCACGNDEIFVISPNSHLKHLGVTKEEILSEFEYVPETSNGIYSDDDYDYSADALLNQETKREYSDHAHYNDTVKTHKVEAEFYAMADSMTIGAVYKKLGKAKSQLIADQISEYYTTKMSL